MYPEINECKQCGQRFIASPEHIYYIKEKNKKVMYCSYTCWRKHKNKTKKLK